MQVETSFIIGFISLFFAASASMIYIVGSRFVRVAAVRKTGVGTVLLRNTREFQNQLGKIRVNSKALDIERSNPPSKAVLFFKFVFLIGLTTAVVVFKLISAIASICFSSMILWRGMQFKVSLDYGEHMKRILEDMHDVFGGLYIAMYPFFKILDFMASFTIDFSGVQVTCFGTQAPLTLLMNLLILGSVMIIIHSEYCEIQFMVLVSALEENMNIVSKRFFWKYVSKKWGSLKYMSALTKATFVSILVSQDGTLFSNYYVNVSA